MLCAITKNHWVTALDGLASLISSLTILSLVRASGLILQSTLSSVTTFYQVPCGFYSFQLTLHASIPGRQGPVSARGLHVPGGRQSFCTYCVKELALFPSHLQYFFFLFFFFYLWCFLQIYMTCILKATLASAPSDAQHKSCSFANGYVHAV